MAIKIYNEGGGVVIDDGVKVTISNFSFINEGNDTITVVDDDRKADAWNDFYYNFQDKLGAPAGATVQDVMDYLSDVQSVNDVESVNGKTGVVVLDTSDIADTLDKRYVTDAEQTVIGNTSGTNTGDQDLSGKEDVGVASGLIGTHESTYDHTDIAHTNRAALDLVSGTNTGDQDLSGLADAGANSDITSMSGLTGDVASPDTLSFNPIASPTYQRGRIFYNKDEESLSYYDDISGTEINIGQEQIIRARNNTGGTLLDGTVVYISGAVGQNPTIQKAQANVKSTARSIGLCTHDISNNTVGKVTTFGIVRGIDTSSFNDGDKLWLSSSVSGGLTNTEPVSPNYSILIGIVTDSHPTSGSIFVDTEKTLNLGLGTANQFLKVNGAADGQEYTTLTASDVTDLTTVLDSRDTANRARANHTGTQAFSTVTGTVPIAQGGSGQTTAQAAIDALSNVAAATNEHVLTKDTGTGNAVWKVAAGASAHNDLSGLQGGTAGQYFHLTSANHTRLTTWQPPTVNITEGSTIGVTVFINDNDQGKYYSFPNNADSKISFNFTLKGSNGLTYDASNMAMLVRWRPSVNASAGNTVAWILTTAIIKDGDNSATKFTAAAQQTQTITGFLQNITYTTQLTTISGTGESGAHTLLMTIERNGTGASSDSFGGAVEILSIELIKV